MFTRQAMLLPEPAHRLTTMTSFEPVGGHDDYSPEHAGAWADAFRDLQNLQALHHPTGASNSLIRKAMRQHRSLFHAGRSLAAIDSPLLVGLRFVATHAFETHITRMTAEEPYSSILPPVLFGSSTADLSYYDRPAKPIERYPRDLDYSIAGEDGNADQIGTIFLGWVQRYVNAQNALFMAIGSGIDEKAYDRGFGAHRDKRARNLLSVTVLCVIDDEDVRQFLFSNGSRLASADRVALQNFTDRGCSDSDLCAIGDCYARAFSNVDQPDPSNAWNTWRQHLAPRPTAIPVAFTIDVRVGVPSAPLFPIRMKSGAHEVLVLNPLLEMVNKIHYLIFERDRIGTKHLAAVLDLSKRFDQAKAELKCAPEIVVELVAWMTVIQFPTVVGFYENDPHVSPRYTKLYASDLKLCAHEFYRSHAVNFPTIKAGDNYLERSIDESYPLYAQVHDRIQAIRELGPISFYLDFHGGMNSEVENRLYIVEHLLQRSVPNLGDIFLTTNPSLGIRNYWERVAEGIRFAQRVHARLQKR